CARKQANFDFW
nr:immunoglobulin heavy chain junction region [Macaca mulatta]MOV48813.1 immunoglobulin heavy chain junction region [Macaca mulatta]MOV48846.1 immunoglobulin heavy chain junction region [Macaca mulatta]MOV48924.1 immunoglobulin heavy chain junction region [Macaca mulatta]MOV49039.1 immunoglobulin heavy chain junction region [Macaca mulatta]